MGYSDVSFPPEVLMAHRNIKIAVTAVVLVGAFAGLLWSSLREGTEYYKHVDEVMTDAKSWEGKRLQLHGYAIDVRQRPGTLEYRFKVQNKGSVVNASYTGIVPDTFKDDAEVVLKGRLAPDGFHVEPNGVMAKCPSKYEAQKKVG
jgi:cytochrome c-type biogenesis protein CcmE